MAGGHLIPALSAACEVLTAAEAAAMLDRTPGRRDDRAAGALAATFAAGGHQPGAGVILVAADGSVADGRHRLAGQVLAGLTLEWIVVRLDDRESPAVVVTQSR